MVLGETSSDRITPTYPRTAASLESFRQPKMGFIASGAGIVYLAIGIAALVVLSQNPNTTCSFQSFLPLQPFLLGTGIAYIIMGACMSVFGIVAILSRILAIPVILVLICSGGFTFAWMIVGAVTLWRPQDHGYDCSSVAYPIWAMAMATVITTIILWGMTCIGGSAEANYSEE